MLEPPWPGADCDSNIMNRILHLALDMFWLAIIVGCTVIVLARALKRSDDPPKIVFKIVFSLALI